MKEEIKKAIDEVKNRPDSQSSVEEQVKGPKDTEEYKDDEPKKGPDPKVLEASKKIAEEEQRAAAQLDKKEITEEKPKETVEEEQPPEEKPEQEEILPRAAEEPVPEEPLDKNKERFLEDTRMIPKKIGIDETQVRKEFKKLHK